MLWLFDYSIACGYEFVYAYVFGLISLVVLTLHMLVFSVLILVMALNLRMLLFSVLILVMALKLLVLLFLILLMILSLQMLFSFNINYGFDLVYAF